MSYKTTDNYAPWVERLYSAPLEKRMEAVDTTLSEFAERGERAERIAHALADNKEFEKLSLLGYLHYTPLTTTAAKGYIHHWKFDEPVIAAKHRTLPMILAVSRRFPTQIRKVLISSMKDSMGPVQALSYTETLSRMGKEAKEALFIKIMNGVKSYRGTTQSGGKKWLTDYLTEGKDFKFAGFVANLPYINLDKDYGETDTFWVHSWGTPQLLFMDKHLPVIMLVGPSIRLDENVLGHKDMTGFTG